MKRPSASPQPSRSDESPGHHEGALGSELLNEVPEFREGHDDHVDDYDEVIHHVLMGDFARFVMAVLEDGQNDVVNRSLAFLERAAQTGDERVVDLGVTSFLENLHEDSPHYDALKAQFGPTLARALARLDTDWRGHGAG